MYVTITIMYTILYNEIIDICKRHSNPHEAHVHRSVFRRVIKNGSMMLNVDVQCTVPKQPFTRPPLKDSPACTLIANRHQQCSWALSPPNPAPVHDH